MRIEPAEMFAVVMFFIAFYGLITSRNILKSVVFVVVMEVAAIMFFLSIGYRAGIRAPIGPNLEGLDMGQYMYVADPFPQALMITAIVIGLSVTTVMLVMTITMIRKYETTDWDTIKARAKAQSLDY